MAAGVSAVQPSRNPGTLIPTQKVGTEFLEASHFTIAQDNTVTPKALKSVFKKDYIAHDIYTKPEGAKPPPPANFQHGDERFFNKKVSETAKEYEYRHLDKPELINDRAKLSATNFKMDRDVSKFNSFNTTHALDYTPKQGGAGTRGEPKGNPMQSFIPQGDRDKAPLPISDYRDRYRGHDASARPEKVTGIGQGGHPTIKGDNRQHHFHTTHNDTFRGCSLPKLQAMAAPVGSNIPQGDPSKETSMQTTQQASFVRHDLSGLSGYSKEDIMGKLQLTNFRQDDGHGQWNNYRSTMSESYQPFKGPRVSREGPARDRNQSDFPRGDNDPYRNAARANMTTNRFYHGDPPPTMKPHIVSGASKRTQSQVWFGEPRQADQFYETTTDSTFRPTSVPYQYHRPDLNTKSSVPMDYWANERTNPTTWSDFQDPRQGKTIPNPLAIANLKESHIKAPLGGERQFTTEHLDQYTAKAVNRYAKADAGRLQRSSVPLGTLAR